MTAPALILVPGLLCNDHNWWPQAAAFGSDFNVVVPDHGLIDSLPGMAAAILEQAPERFAIAGHSMGGRVTLEVFRQAPERVAGLALLDTGVHPVRPGEAGEREAAGRYKLLEQARSEGMRPMVWAWLQNMLHPDRLQDRELVDGILDMMSSKSPDVFAAQIRALLGRPDGTPLLREIRCPALVLCGEQDTWAPPRQHREIAAHVPHAELVIVPECGHMSTLEQPAPVNAALRRWLDGIVW